MRRHENGQTRVPDFDGERSDGVTGNPLRWEPSPPPEVGVYTGERRLVDAEWRVGLSHEEDLLALVGEFADGSGIVAVPAVRWFGQQPRVTLGRYVEIARVDTEDFDLALADAVRRRKKSFVRCSHCGTKVLPEYRDGRKCHSCMEADGTVF